MNCEVFDCRSQFALLELLHIVCQENQYELLHRADAKAETIASTSMQGARVFLTDVLHAIINFNEYRVLLLYIF
ncbi:hypothetical protein PsorP6_009971 [Peronosclerospora sorghi]|uniref:Uncharacterized protein n=1 Tax=Peronosclerospora sorghi TaxID=230839 RepID=A0ACC0VW12_9STRA|nr:hypothetical protein PsorP6_009971 [Peronosclerospora sorghi]